MRIEIPSPGRLYYPGATAAEELVLRAARAGLLKLRDPMIEVLAAKGVDWPAVLAAANANRLTVFVEQGLRACGASVPREAATGFEGYRAETFRLNSRCLMTIRRIVPLIEAAGVPVAVIKGPVQQALLEVGVFAKPAGDVDLLVPPGAFERARRVLEAGGYSLPAECDSLWWRMFLGEQHFFAPDASLSTIDLHHRLQQPGCPSPKRVDRFLARRRRLAVGGLEAPTLELVDASLLMCMSLVKAMFHHEPAGGYAADLATVFSRADEDWLRAFCDEARRQGLHNTARLAFRVLELLFGVLVDIACPAEPRILDTAIDDDLVAMALSPTGSRQHWARRRTILWELNDRGLTAYGREAGWALAGEACRMLFQRPDAAGRAAA